jgi:hypothetical protein
LVTPLPAAPRRRVVEQPMEGELAAALIGAFRLTE